MTREELIKELIDTFDIKADGITRKLPNWTNIAEWIIEDRKRVVEPLVNLSKLRWIRLLKINEMQVAIDQTLKNAGIE